MPTPIDISTAMVPLWAALTVIGGVLSALGAIVVWVFSTFETKLEASERHEALRNRVDSHETLLSEVARDVSYIRGRIEPK